MQYLLGKGRKDKSGDFTKGAELEECQIKKIISFLNIKNLSENNYENIKKIAEGNQTMQEGIAEMQLMEKYFSLFNFTNYIFDPTLILLMNY